MVGRKEHVGAVAVQIVSAVPSQPQLHLTSGCVYRHLSSFSLFCFDRECCVYFIVSWSIRDDIQLLLLHTEIDVGNHELQVLSLIFYRSSVKEVEFRIDGVHKQLFAVKEHSLSCLLALNLSVDRSAAAVPVFNWYLVLELVKVFKTIELEVCDWSEVGQVEVDAD